MGTHRRHWALIGGTDGHSWAALMGGTDGYLWVAQMGTDRWALGMDGHCGVALMDTVGWH